MSGHYAAFAHTGDVGLEIHADSAAELFATAGRALTEQMAHPASGDVVRERLELDGSGWEDLLVHWLNTLLLRSELAQAWWTDFEIETLSPSGLVAVISGPRRGPQHERMREVKAVSYHGLTIELAPGRCVARVVLDL